MAVLVHTIALTDSLPAVINLLKDEFMLQLMFLRVSERFLNPGIHPIAAMVVWRVLLGRNICLSGVWFHFFASLLRSI